MFDNRTVMIGNKQVIMHVKLSVGVRSRVQKFSGLTYKSRAKWKMLWGIYSAIYELLVHRCEKSFEIKGDYVEK